MFSFLTCYQLNYLRFCIQLHTSSEEKIYLYSVYQRFLNINFHLRRFSQSRSSSGSTPSIHPSIHPPFLWTFDKCYLILRAVELRQFPYEMLRGYLVCVICNSSSFHSSIFILCIMIVRTMNMYSLSFCTFDKIFLSVELRHCYI